MKTKFSFILSSIFTCLLLAVAAQAAETLPPNSRLAIIGDSITEQKLYSKYVETYLLVCAGRQDIQVFQYGWGGETASGFAARLENDLTPFAPTVATTCYGMNDGQYRPFVDDVGRNYESNMRKVITGLQKLGVKTIVLGSPGAVDTKFFNNKSFAPLSGAEGYNQSLGRLRDIDRKLAAEYGQSFADVHQPMVDTMARAKAKWGDEYDVCGRDGVHPGPNGQLLMAYAFLKALGCDGNIGEITVDVNGTATASPGHKVISATTDKIELESSRYPFCLEGDEKSPAGTRSITAVFPFMEELNRFTLRVKNLSASRAKVTWGEQSRDFSREQLAQGINLAKEFPSTPFEAQFRRVIDRVGAKQGFETPAIKSMITQFRQFGQDTRRDPELAQAFKQVTARLMARQAELSAAVRETIIPVKHTITISSQP